MIIWISRVTAMTPKFLDKSKFILSMDCPTKLYYHVRPDEYQNLKTENTFLQALAKAGYQVGELAKCYYQDQSPHDLMGIPIEEALAKSSELLAKENVVIFEAAIAHNNLLLRADILIKRNNRLKVIEVKSSCWDKSKDSFFKKRDPGIDSKWVDYIYDIAFQKTVIEKAYPSFDISSCLALLDKNAKCPTQGLNQKFRISRDENGSIKISGREQVTSEDLKERLVLEVNVDDAIQYVRERTRYRDDLIFEEYAQLLASHLNRNEKMLPKLGKICASCEFRVPQNVLDPGKKCGFRECWTHAAGFAGADFNRPSVLDLWSYLKKDQLIKDGIYFIDQVEEKDILPKKSEVKKELGLSRSERQLLQVKIAKDHSGADYIDKEGLSSEIATWVYPLHFIDFETAAPAIPLDKGAHPYEGFAFQFSHHSFKEDGTIWHADQFLNTEIGVNPNLSFIRALCKSLSEDEGTIFRYHNHENTYLNYIHRWLLRSGDEIEDKQELINFVQSIAKPSSGVGGWEPGKRCMVDLCKLVELYSFDSSIDGKTSIKKVLPSILKKSEYLQNKYSQKIYGKNAEIKSLNYDEPRAWVVKDGGDIIDPYSLLPKLFENINISAEEIELFFDDDELREGGTASIAYMCMQFSEMSGIEREHLRNALLRYCELDTLAMVMIVEYWFDILS